MVNQGLEVENLHLSIGGWPLLRGLHLRVAPGEIVLLQGENGSGKTSFLRCIAGILKAEKGVVRWQGEAIAGQEDYGLRMAYIGHAPAVDPALTPRETLTFWARIYGRSELIEAALHYFDLERYADFACRELSAGWRQKVALARLLLSPARLWLLDEPASHLDIAGSNLLQSLISARKEQGGAIVMAMHGDVTAEGVRSYNIDQHNQLHEEEI